MIQRFTASCTTPSCSRIYWISRQCEKKKHLRDELLEFFDTLFEKLDRARVVLLVHQFAAFGALELELHAPVEVHA